MVRTAGSGARPAWAGYQSDEDNFESEEEVVSDEEYKPSKASKGSKKVTNLQINLLDCFLPHGIA